ncbi:MAG: inositol monophosphatase [Alphaproteobacteria bacterium]|nr:inositol monophosphatase [Alphaproteobacteria bacterium]
MRLRELSALDDILRAASRTEIMPRFRRLADGDVRTKTGPLDLVTEADEAAERMITAALLREFPGCVIVGEEATSADPSLLGALAAAELAFVVDPVDGTSNFAWGMPLFGCMAAAIRRGEIIGAVIHDPIIGMSAMALRGEGAWNQEADGRRIDMRVADPVPVAEMNGGANWRFLPEPQRSRVGQRLDRVGASYGYRCAAHEYRLIAGGHSHYLLYGKLMPWDHAPGWLLHQEAGGYSAHFDGTQYRPTATAGGLICTPDEASFLALREALLGD